MSSIALGSPPRRLPSPAVFAGLGVAAAIAWLEPFDRLFGTVTLGDPWLRAVLIVVLAGIGLRAGSALGLRAAPPASRDDIGVCLLAAVAVAVGCAAVDRLCRGSLDAGYVHGLTATPLAVRTPVFMMHAFNEEVLYRLFLGPVLALAFATGTPPGPGRNLAVWGGFILAQAINVAVNVSLGPRPDAPALLYEVVRFFAPGLVWASLYKSRAFGAAVVGHMGTHLLFQPLIGVVLTA